ncbi:hypothetical protein C8J57DRAFT_1491611 [Mycena rebaudengoi]|nr:hypothetical protein C8J57DRAFT_1491611 [Mycena rebaudengoi]
MSTFSWPLTLNVAYFPCKATKMYDDLFDGILEDLDSQSFPYKKPLAYFKGIWPNGPDMTIPKKLDMLVMSEESVAIRAAIASLPTDLCTRRRGAIARQTLTRTLGTLPTPSTCSSDPKQLFEHAGTLAGRPFGRCGPPTPIFDSHLAGLTDALRNLTQAVPVPSPSKVAWGLRFFTVAIGFHNNEAGMERIMWPLINELFGDVEECQESIDGSLKARGPGWIYEFKMQKGLGGDPEAQSIADYEKLLADKTTMVHPLLHFSVHLLIRPIPYQAGPQLNIAVVVYAQAVLVDQLFSINLRDGIDVDEQVLALARLGTCLTNTWADLSQYYNGLLQATAPVSPLRYICSTSPCSNLCHPFPFPSLRRPQLEVSLQAFCITGAPLNPDDETDQRMNTRHAVFVAWVEELGGIPTEEVVVKFTKRYNTTAHTKLAALGLAPQLYYHAAVRGGLLMTALHSAGLVFGDLRLPNIMIRVGERDDNGGSSKAQGHGYADASPRSDRGSMDTGSRGAASKSSSSNTKEHDGKPADSDSGGINVHALLIDFDWAAEDGVGRYPATISTSDEWAPTVVPFGLMHKAHDLYCLDLLRQKCN